MELLAAVGGGTFVLASIVIGLRLIVMWRHTRELPELLVGCGLLFMGGLGYPFVAAARLGVTFDDPTRMAFGLLGLLLTWAGQVAVCAFNWRVFRPSEHWARAVTAIFGVALAACIVLQIASPGLRAAAIENRGIGLRLFFDLLGVPLAWGAFESFRHHALLVRRERLGLADPVVTDRLWLWAFAMASSLVLNTTSSVAAMFGVDFPMTSVGALVTAVLGLAASGALWLAFLAPASYHERVRARAMNAATSGVAKG